jgi:uncharacterized membrane protein YfcA
MVLPVICGAFTGLWIMHRIPQRFFDGLILVITAISTIILFR